MSLAPAVQGPHGTPSFGGRRRGAADRDRVHGPHPHLQGQLASPSYSPATPLCSEPSPRSPACCSASPLCSTACSRWSQAWSRLGADGRASSPTSTSILTSITVLPPPDTLPPPTTRAATLWGIIGAVRPYRTHNGLLLPLPLPLPLPLSPWPCAP